MITFSLSSTIEVESGISFLSTRKKVLFFSSQVIFNPALVIHRRSLPWELSGQVLSIALSSGWSSSSSSCSTDADQRNQSLFFKKVICFVTVVIIGNNLSIDERFLINYNEKSSLTISAFLIMFHIKLGLTAKLSIHFIKENPPRRDLFKDKQC